MYDLLHKRTMKENRTIKQNVEFHKEREKE